MSHAVFFQRVLETGAVSLQVLKIRRSEMKFPGDNHRVKLDLSLPPFDLEPLRGREGLGGGYQPYNL